MPYFADEFVSNRLIILYLLERLNIEITSDMLYRIMVENGWQNYFDFYSTLYGLEEDGYLLSVERACGKVYRPSPEGKEALALFEESIPFSLRERIDAYANIHAESIRQELQYTSRIEKAGRGYRVTMKVLDHDTSSFEVSLILPDSRLANTAARNWPKVAPEVFPVLFEKLTNEEGSQSAKDD